MILRNTVQRGERLKLIKERENMKNMKNYKKCETLKTIAPFLQHILK